MSARGFGSVMMVGAVAGAALGCYLVSLRVAAERASVDKVEGRIVLAQRDIRLLQTEIGTRGRLAQLERWNAKFIRLSAPSADQFVDSGFVLATLVKPQDKPAVTAPVVYASIPTEQSLAARPDQGDSDADFAPTAAAVAATSAPTVASQASARPAAPFRASRTLGQMMHVASYDRPELAEMTAPNGAVPAPRPTTRPAATKSVKLATKDPLSALPGAGAAGMAVHGPTKSARSESVRPSPFHAKDPGAKR